MLKNRAKKRSKRRGNVPAHLARAGSFSSVTDSTMSLNCITVTLNMDTVSFLGISIVGQVRSRLGRVHLEVAVTIATLPYQLHRTFHMT